MAWDVRMSMGGHVSTMRCQGRQQEEQQKELTENSKSRHPVTCQHVTKTDNSAVINQPES